ncbi:UNVERIFIED_CONTAM: hypothetical protein HDU68_002583 [Siphonaria sp. JEL0065]|nr:hypothetical protein HDU68_002583 [Siphonaria sp. JEL0065]
MITGAQMQGCLMAFLPQLVNVNFGNLVVDMFVTSSLVIIIMDIIGLFGSTARQVIDDNSSNQRDRGIPSNGQMEQQNIHWKALAWLITQRSKSQTKGQFRMVPYVPENDGDSSSDEEEDQIQTYMPDIPQFNILPLGDRELEIEYNETKFVVQFEPVQSNDLFGDSTDGKKKNSTPVDPLINREPPILIRRVEGETASLEWMQTTLNEITKIYAKIKASKKRRARYERPADCS